MKLLNRLFIALTLAVLATMSFSISAQAGGLAFDAAGNLYVADLDKHSVFKYTPDGTKSTFATGLRHPLGLSFDGEGNLFVSDGAVTDDTSQSSILKFGPDRRKSTFVTGISSVGMAFDRSGNLYASHGDSIFKFTPEGVKSTFVSGLGNALYLAFDGAGNLFVADQALSSGIGRAIFKFGSDGTKTTFAGGLDDPSGLAIDAVGNVYVAEVPPRYILRFSPDGTKSTFSSALGARGPSLDLAVGRSGNVFVWNGHAILKFDPSGTPSTFGSDWISPDKQWEYKCAEYGLGQCAPEIVKPGTTQVVLDLDEELQVHGPEADQAEVIWATDSKRFAFNYSPPHAHHTTYETVAFYQLRGDKWVALRAPVDETSDRAQLAQLLKEHLPKGFNTRHCAPDSDILKLRAWTDANTATLYAPCYGRSSGQLEAGFLFTLRFDDAGRWKIVTARQTSKKELEEEQ